MKTLSLQLYRLASWTQEIPKYVIFNVTCTTIVFHSKLESCAKGK